MSVSFDPSCSKAVEEVRGDSLPLNWVSFKYATKNKIEVQGTGEGGFNEFKSSLKQDACTWAFLRLYSGDQESRRAKFVLVQFNGSELTGIAKSRAGIHKPDVEAMVGQHHVFFFADGPDELTEELVMDKITKSAGANYDLGSNAKGYSSKAGDIKAAAASTYRTKEKEGNAQPVTYCDTALPTTTPCDLSGRPTVAPSTELRKNYDLKGKLDVNKWESSHAPKTSYIPKPAATTANPSKSAALPRPAVSAAAPAHDSEAEREATKLCQARGSVSAAGKAFEARNEAERSPPSEIRRTGGIGMEAQRLVCDPSCRTAVDEVREDSIKTDWVAFKYATRNKLEVQAKGEGGFKEFKSSLSEDACTWAFLRLYSGDQESRRAKFVLLQYNGKDLSGMAKSRTGVNKPDVEAMVGQHHMFFFADGPDELTEELVMDKITKSAGANYDLGSNAKGYSSKAGDIKAAAASTYRTKEKEGNAQPVTYCDTALPTTTPCDLSGRPTVAPSTELRKNYDLKGKLDVNKWQTGTRSQQSPSPEKLGASALAATSSVEQVTSAHDDVGKDMHNKLEAGEGSSKGDEKSVAGGAQDGSVHDSAQKNDKPADATTNGAGQQSIEHSLKNGSETQAPRSQTVEVHTASKQEPAVEEGASTNETPKDASETRVSDQDAQAIKAN